ncbi:dihydroneopterin aldolase [Microcella indica]|uniref:dihydroneopterin aldolase n=1 Tax=Microcella indica TaxID=2750620 RepID=UPI0015CF5367|nr:dihydroneopterin aldolase [Microcella indica]MBU1251187.1 dihydroneopterin aldolase [Actinomycetota bacterium]MBU1608805.1 dihydroneopterin aldolase [Actinomycetota bacterium]MBU2316669.1 dihydroneopterin aldolase [Actinomycetota bacterium]MBU2385882.1 dihydroneopterin aldolase [Actinomycetota bacterium]
MSGAARDTITLTGVRARGHHGVLADERRDGQEFVVDVALTLDLARAAASDDVADTVHYGELAEAIVAAIERDPVDLIETLAERIAALVLEHVAVHEVVVTVHKPHAPIPVPFDDVAVTITRGRP